MRWEIGHAVWSWMDNGVPVFVTIGEHCIDTAWPWWYPALPDEPMGTPPQAVLPLEDPDGAQGVVSGDDEAERPARRYKRQL